MDKASILNKLKKVSGNRYLKFPTQMDFSIKGHDLIVKVNGNGVVCNMQTNGSAFEGWIVCIKAFLEEIKYVVLDWEKPCWSELPDEKTRQEKHYNRFVMRVALFQENYRWVRIAESKTEEIDKHKETWKSLVMNYPISESKEQAADNKGEAILEREITKEMQKEQGISDHQLPVGLFKEFVLEKNTFTPRNGSQIDIWQLSGNTLNIYELKDKKNKSVGIISELMFYANVMYLFLNQDINYPPDFQKTNKNYRHEANLYTAVNNKAIKNINAVFLNYSFHSLIEKNIEGVLAILNENKYRITFLSEKVSKYKV